MLAHRHPIVAAFSVPNPTAEPRLLKTSKVEAPLTAAQLYAIENPQNLGVCLIPNLSETAPSTGPNAMNIQVAAALEVYRKHRLAGAWINLDTGIHGDIEDARMHNFQVNRAIPPGCDLQINSEHQNYLKVLHNNLGWLSTLIRDEKINWLVVAHGIDSQVSTGDFPGRLTVEEREHSAKLVYRWLSRVEARRGKPLPLTIALTTPMERNTPTASLDLLSKDLETCLHYLIRRNIRHNS
jgi:hypothetical protein